MVLGPLLRPLIELHWARDVARWSGVALEDTALQAHLFGVERTAFPSDLVGGLHEIQHGRCFYCDEPVVGRGHVDHFLAWSRWPNNAVENLVLADRCNLAKSDHLVTDTHLDRWITHLEEHASALAEVARGSNWTSDRPTVRRAGAQHLRPPVRRHAAVAARRRLRPRDRAHPSVAGEPFADELTGVDGSLLGTQGRSPAMGITSITTVLNVADHELGVAWYSDLFGREPDRRPMDGSAEWQLTETSAVMVYADAERAGGGTLIVGVADLDAHAAELYEREIVLEPYTVPSGQFRLAELADPSGNTVTFAQQL